MPNWMKMIEAKVALAKRGAKPSRSGDNPRIPPGQKQVHDFPVLDIGLAPDVSPSSWNLRVFGLVENELDFNPTGLHHPKISGSLVLVRKNLSCLILKST